MWPRKPDEALKQDNKLLPLWERQLQVKNQLSETPFSIVIGPGRHQEVHCDRLKAEVPCPMDSYKPLCPTSKYLSDRKTATGSFDLETILDYKKDVRDKWLSAVHYFCCLKAICARRR